MINHFFLGNWKLYNIFSHPLPSSALHDIGPQKARMTSNECLSAFLFKETTYKISARYPEVKCILRLRHGLEQEGKKKVNSRITT